MLLRIFLATLATTGTFLTMAACATQPADLDLSLTRESFRVRTMSRRNRVQSTEDRRSTAILNDRFAAGI